MALAGPVSDDKEALAVMLASQLAPDSGMISGSNDTLPTIGLLPTDRHASGYAGSLGFFERKMEARHVGGLARQTTVISLIVKAACGAVIIIAAVLTMIPRPRSSGVKPDLIYGVIKVKDRRRAGPYCWVRPTQRLCSKSQSRRAGMS